MKFKMLLIAIVLSLSGLLQARFTHLQLQICPPSAANVKAENCDNVKVDDSCRIETFMADSGDFKTSLDTFMQVQLKLPVTSHVRISGAVSSENENIVDGCIRPVRLFSYVQSGHGLIVHHDFQFKNPYGGARKIVWKSLY